MMMMIKLDWNWLYIVKFILKFSLRFLFQNIIISIHQIIDILPYSHQNWMATITNTTQANRRQSWFNNIGLVQIIVALSPIWKAFKRLFLLSTRGPINEKKIRISAQHEQVRRIKIHSAVNWWLRISDFLMCLQIVDCQCIASRLSGSRWKADPRKVHFLHGC